MIDQNLLNQLKDALTKDELQDLKVQFGVDSLEMRSKWSRMWNVSPQLGQYNRELVEAALTLLHKRTSANQNQVLWMMDQFAFEVEEKETA